VLDQLTVLNLDPLAFLEVAAEAGYDGIGLHLEGLAVPWSAQYSLLDDGPLRRAFAARQRALGLDLHVAEPARAAQGLATLNAEAMARGLALSLEPYFLSQWPTMSAALAAARQAGGTAGVTLDAFHVIRGGEHWTHLAGLDPALVRTVQVGDGPLAAPADRGFEAVADRMAPGEGAFDLATLGPLLPDGVPIGIEVPSVERCAAMGALAWARLLRERTEALLAA
jgi:sugar phosphate isomerase/epimerase